jgi:hypothetical protein
VRGKGWAWKSSAFFLQSAIVYKNILIVLYTTRNDKKWKEIMNKLSSSGVIAGVFCCAVFASCSDSKRGGRHRETPDSPPVAVSVAPEVIKPAINVYIENSGSMDGYVNGETGFKNTVYNYLGDIKISDVANSLNLFYINSRIIPQEPVIADFIKNLNPATFKARGGDRGTSDMDSVLKQILSATNDTTLSILVSDCIFSPGKGRDASQYLVNQQIGIKVSMADHLKRHNTAVAVYQLSSRFSGRYYNREDTPTEIAGNRPFYIWLIGSPAHIGRLRGKVPESRFLGGGARHIFSITPVNQPADYAVRPGSGKFSLNHAHPQTAIVNAEKDRNGLLTVAVDANLSPFLLDDDYLADVANYRLSDKDFQLAVSGSPSNSHGYTCALKLSASIVKPATVSVKLMTRVPQWVEEVTDEDGLDIHAPGAMDKTYGFKYLIQGIYEAYTKESDFYTDIRININN